MSKQNTIDWEKSWKELEYYIKNITSEKYIVSDIKKTMKHIKNKNTFHSETSLNSSHHKKKTIKTSSRKKPSTKRKNQKRKKENMINKILYFFGLD